MRFTFNGALYTIGFERKHRYVNVFSDGKVRSVQSKYPYTTATLYKKTGTNTSDIVAQATVGCMPLDRYSNETGRVLALRAITRQLRKQNKDARDFRAALWQAYVKRGSVATVVEGEVIPAATEQPTQQLALPPATEGEQLDERVIH